MKYNNMNFYINDQGYYTSDSYGKLHRYIYKEANGDIPKGHIIHHKDGNKANNDINNLQCMTRSNHTTLHHLGRKHTEKTRQNMREAHLGKRPNKKTLLKLGKDRIGIPRKEEVKRKISKTLSKPIRCLETNKIYPSVKSAINITGFSGIYKAVLGYNKTAGSFHWEYV